jgi:hypothetical protein
MWVAKKFPFFSPTSHSSLNLPISHPPFLKDELQPLIIANQAPASKKAIKWTVEALQKQHKLEQRNYSQISLPKQSIV